MDMYELCLWKNPSEEKHTHETRLSFSAFFLGKKSWKKSYNFKD